MYYRLGNSCATCSAITRTRPARCPRSSISLTGSHPVCFNNINLFANYTADGKECHTQITAMQCNTRQ